MSDDLKRLHNFADYDEIKHNLEKVFASSLDLPVHSRYERHFIWGAIRRTHSLSLAMRQSIEAKNGQMVSTLIRLNLDTLARFHALFWADETPDLTSEEFAKQVFDGKQIRDFSLREGKQKALDWWLIKQITPLADWIPVVYKNASGAIHFSDFHVHQVLMSSKKLRDISDTDDEERLVSMDPTDQSPDIEDYQKAKAAFSHISMMLVAAIKDRIKHLER